jgi:hypothetical protein
MGYSPNEHRPLPGYATLTAAFGVAFGSGLAGVARRGFPERVGAGDLALLGVATHKLSRLIAKDKVTSFVRAPFTRYEGDGGPGEVEETPRGTGLQLAVGELLVCPYCLSQWVSAGLLTSFALAPRATRFVAAVYAVQAASDALQIAYKLGEEQL